MRLDAPVQTVWQALSQCETQIQFVPGLRECDVLETGPDWSVNDQTFKYAFPFPTIRTRVRTTFRPYTRTTLEGAGGDVKSLDGV